MRSHALALVLCALPLTGCLDLLLGKPQQPSAAGSGQPSASSADAGSSMKNDKPVLDELVGSDPDTQNIKRLADLRPGMSREEVDAILPGAKGSKKAFVDVALREPGVDHAEIYFRDEKAVTVKVFFSAKVSDDALWEELKEIAIKKYGEVEEKEKASDRIYFSRMNSSISKAKGKGKGHELEFQIDDHVSNSAPLDRDAVFGADKNKVPNLVLSLKQGMTVDEVAKLYPSVASADNAKQKFKDVIVSDVGGVRALKLYFPKDKLEGIEIEFRRSASKAEDFDATFEYLSQKYGKTKKDDHVSWSKPKMSISLSDAFFDEFKILFH